MTTSCKGRDKSLAMARAGVTLLPLWGGVEELMRSKLIGLLIGCGLAAIIAPALACDYGKTAQSSQSSSQQTAQTQSAADTGSN
jgi:hypothetical protein